MSMKLVSLLLSLILAALVWIGVELRSLKPVRFGDLVKAQTEEEHRALLYQAIIVEPAQTVEIEGRVSTDFQIRQPLEIVASEPLEVTVSKPVEIDDMIPLDVRINR